MKKQLSTLEEITDALMRTVVNCSINNSSTVRTVKAARRKNGSLEVRVLEGWRLPIEVWIEETEAK